MATILEELKSRLAAAQKRQLDATQRFAAAQSELQTAQVEVNAWTTAFNIESRDENLRTAAATRDQLPMELPVEQLPATFESHVESEAEPMNKTEIVREMLRQHPNGMSSSDLWKGFQEHAPGTSRQYLYSVLKRLRDKEYVCVRRGKYALKAKPTEAGGEQLTIQ